MNQIDFFLKSKAFDVIEKRISDEFGDYSIIYSKDFLLIKISSDKSQISIDIKSYESQEWFDFYLVKAMITKEKDLIKLDIDEAIDVLKDHYEEIISLFGNENYSKTEQRLKDLEKIRMKQMFPNM